MEEGQKIRIIGFNCGKCAQQRFCHMGIVCGKEATIECIQPFGGPIMIKIGNSKYTIGRGLFNKIEYEVIE